MKQKGFTLSAEVIPPRNGAEQRQVLNQIMSLVQGGAEFLAVTKGAGGSLRGGSLPIAQAIKEKFEVPCIAHFTCRDLTPMDVENSLMDHHYFGIRNILALRGDPPDGDTTWQPRDGGYHYAHQLIAQIKRLNQGTYLERRGGPDPGARETTDFCIGAAVYPEHPDPEERIRFFLEKVRAGAEFAVTDMLFDWEAYARFAESCAKHSVTIPILPGTRILKSRTQAEKMMKKFRVNVPCALLKRLPENDSPETREIGLELFMELTGKLRGAGAPGIHLFVISDTDGAKSALDRLSTDRSQKRGLWSGETNSARAWVAK